MKGRGHVMTILTSTTRKIAILCTMKEKTERKVGQSGDGIWVQFKTH